MRDRKFCFVDLETTGLNPSHEILEIGGLTASAPTWDIEESFAWKTKPQHLERADPESLKINGYSEEAWKSAIPLEQALRLLHQKTKGMVLAGFNSHFDWARLEKAFFDYGMDDPFHWQRIDVLSIAFVKMKDLPVKNTLTAVCQHFDIPRGKAHSAYDDALAAYRIFLKLMGVDSRG